MKTISLTLLLAIFFSLYPQKVKAQEDTVKVGFILANLYLERWQKDKEYFETKFNELGGKVIFKDCYDLPENQLTAAKELIADSIDALIIIAIDAKAAAKVVTLAKNAGIPSIAYDRLILNCPLDYFITYNSVTVGELMASAVKRKISSGNILFIGGPSDDHNSAFIREGVFNILAPGKRKYSVFEEQVSSWTELDAYLKVHDYVAQHNSLPDAIICAADILTRGAINVAEENGKLGSVILTGQDAELDICRFIAQDKVDLTIYKPGKLMAELAAYEIIKIIKNKTFISPETVYNGQRDVPSLLLEPYEVNKYSMQRTVIDDGYYTMEQVYGD